MKKLLILILLTSPVLAWGPNTQNFITQTAIDNVWGPGTYTSCIEESSVWQKIEYCGWLQPEYQSGCMLSYDNPRPEYLPTLLFKDDEKTSNYEICPAHPPPTEIKYICGDGINHAWIEGMKWFDKAEEANTKCERVFLFGVASNYFAASFNPLNQVKSETEKCTEILINTVESKLKSEDDWTVSFPCSFKFDMVSIGGYRPGKYSQKFTVTPMTFTLIIENISQTGEKLISNVEPKTRMTEGLIRNCEYEPGEQTCGNCYCLETNTGCGNINLGSFKGDMERFIDKTVKVKTIINYSTNEICPQEYKILTISVVDIPSTTLPTTTTTTTSSTTSTTIPSQMDSKDFLPVILGLLLVITGCGFVLIFVKAGGFKLISKTHLEKAKPDNAEIIKDVIEPPKRMGGVDRSLPDKKSGSTLEEA